MDKQTAKMSNTCYKHKSETTNLSCATCDYSICIKCVIHTPTGIKCKSCANFKKIPTFEITPVYFIRGTISIIITLTLFTIVIIDDIVEIQQRKKKRTFLGICNNVRFIYQYQKKELCCLKMTNLI